MLQAVAFVPSEKSPIEHNEVACARKRPAKRRKVRRFAEASFAAQTENARHAHRTKPRHP